MSDAGIDAVVFDIGNVLIRWDPNLLYSSMGLDADAVRKFRTETQIDALNIELDRGLPFSQSIAAHALAHPTYAELIRAWDERWVEMLGQAIEPAVKALSAVKARGYKVYGLSNVSRTKFDVQRREFPFLDDLDDVVISADHRINKPDPRLYRILLERNSIDPHRTVFIDDSARNIETGIALGMRTIHMTSTDIPVLDRLMEMGLDLA